MKSRIRHSKYDTVATVKPRMVRYWKWPPNPSAYGFGMRLTLYNAHKLETEPSKCKVVRVNVDMGKKVWYHCWNVKRICEHTPPGNLMDRAGSCVNFHNFVSFCASGHNGQFCNSNSLSSRRYGDARYPSALSIKSISVCYLQQEPCLLLRLNMALDIETWLLINNCVCILIPYQKVLKKKSQSQNYTDP